MKRDAVCGKGGKPESCNIVSLGVTCNGAVICRQQYRAGCGTRNNRRIDVDVAGAGYGNVTGIDIANRQTGYSECPGSAVCKIHRPRISSQRRYRIVRIGQVVSHSGAQQFQACCRDRRHLGDSAGGGKFQVVAGVDNAIDGDSAGGVEGDIAQTPDAAGPGAGHGGIPLVSITDGLVILPSPG